MIIKECNSLEEIVTIKGDATIHDFAFVSLEILKLECLPKLNKFCSSKCFLRFPLLEKVVVRECPRMKTFSDGKTSTPNLRKVQVAETDEEVQCNGNLNDTIKNMFADMVAFCSIKHLTLSEYPELEDWWYGYNQLPHNMFCNLKSLMVKRCDFLSDVLFSSNSLQVLLGLEELEVRDCDSLETVFDVKGMKSKEILAKQTTKLKKLTLSNLPSLKHIWNNEPQEIISFGNLCMVDVVECQHLVNLLPFSLCQDLGHLEKLNVESCGVEEIVAMEEGSTEKSFSFPQLTQLRLICLTNLRSFYPGSHTLECPSLKILNVYRCEAFQMLAFDHSNFQQSHRVGEIPDMPIQEGLFPIEKVSPNLEELALNGKDAMKILNGNFQANLFHKVEFLRLQCFDETLLVYLNDLLEIFPILLTLQVRNSSVETLFHKEGIGYLSTGTPKKIRELFLFKLEQLKHIWHEDFTLDRLGVQNIERSSVWSCPSLVRLVPPSIDFKHLTWLKVEDCKGLTYLITTSTAKSLIQLTTLIIKNCEMIEDVVKIEEEEAEEEIIFENLDYLNFTCLSSLRSFCFGKCTFIFPSLVRFIVEGCPKMTTFSPGNIIAPFLTAIEVENEKYEWKDDLNSTIEQLSTDKAKTSTLSSNDSSA